jgi:predicted transcriptional regulator
VSVGTTRYSIYGKKYDGDEFTSAHSTLLYERMRRIPFHFVRSVARVDEATESLFSMIPAIHRQASKAADEVDIWFTILTPWIQILSHRNTEYLAITIQ